MWGGEERGREEYDGAVIWRSAAKEKFKYIYCYLLVLGVKGEMRQDKPLVSSGFVYGIIFLIALIASVVKADEYTHKVKFPPRLLLQSNKK